jgi:hypothetical protein
MERLAFALWLGASASACTGWQTVEVSPEQLVAEQHPNKVRVTRQDGSRVEVEHPSITADTLRGTVQPVTVTTRESEGHGDFSTVTRTVGVDTVTQAIIPVTDVARIERRHVSAGKTAGLVAAILALGAVVAGIVVFATWDCCL